MLDYKTLTSFQEAKTGQVVLSEESEEADLQAFFDLMYGIAPELAVGTDNIEMKGKDLLKLAKISILADEYLANNIKDLCLKYSHLLFPSVAGSHGFRQAVELLWSKLGPEDPIREAYWLQVLNNIKILWKEPLFRKLLHSHPDKMLAILNHRISSDTLLPVARLLWTTCF